MARKRLYLSFALSVAAMFCGGCPAKKDCHHIVALCSIPAFEPIFQGLKAQLAQLGYREGIHVTYEMKYHDGLLSSSYQGDGRSPSAGKIDLFFAFPTEAAIVAKKAAEAAGTPVVFAYAGIENSNLIASVREPGGNITGVRFPGPEQIGKRLELIRAIAPQARRVWVGYQKDYPNNAPALAILRPLAGSFHVELVEVPLTSLEELEADLDRRDRSADPGMDAMILMPDFYNHSPRGWELINEFAHKRHLPLAGSFLYTVQQGAVVGNANDLADVGKFAAPLVAKIFSGIPAGTIPVVTPEQDLYINYRRARELGLKVPEGLLRQAKVIIQ